MCPTCESKKIIEHDDTHCVICDSDIPRNQGRCDSCMKIYMCNVCEHQCSPNSAVLDNGEFVCTNCQDANERKYSQNCFSASQIILSSRVYSNFVYKN